MTATLLAATTAPALPGWLVLVALLWICWRILLCAFFPFAPCGSCAGTGKRRSPGGRTFRRCRRCGGTGQRLRLMRRLWNATGTPAAKDRR